MWILHHRSPFKNCLPFSYSTSCRNWWKLLLWQFRSKYKKEPWYICFAAAGSEVGQSEDGRVLTSAQIPRESFLFFSPLLRLLLRHFLLASQLCASLHHQLQVHLHLPQLRLQVFDLCRALGHLQHQQSALKSEPLRFRTKTEGKSWWPTSSCSTDELSSNSWQIFSTASWARDARRMLKCITFRRKSKLLNSVKWQNITTEMSRFKNTITQWFAGMQITTSEV